MAEDGQRWLDGGCRCGAVRYRVADAFGYGLICHCSQCRKTTGAANKPFLGIEIEHVELTSGADEVQRFGSKAEWETITDDLPQFEEHPT